MIGLAVSIMIGAKSLQEKPEPLGFIVRGELEPPYQGKVYTETSFTIGFMVTNQEGETVFYEEGKGPRHFDFDGNEIKS